MNDPLSNATISKSMLRMNETVIFVYLTSFKGICSSISNNNVSGLSKLTKGKGISENPLALSDILEVERLIMVNQGSQTRDPPDVCVCVRAKVSLFIVGIPVLCAKPVLSTLSPFAICVDRRYKCGDRQLFRIAEF
jgi:hypothetical protein